MMEDLSVVNLLALKSCANQYCGIKSGANQMHDLKGVACSDEHTENYHPALRPVFICFYQLSLLSTKHNVE